MNRFHIYPLLIIVLLLSGCYQNTQVRGVMVIPAETHSTTVVTQYGPPPFAPAHGYRYRYYDHDLRFDATSGAYIVIGNPGLYFYRDHYIRYYNHRWQTTNRLRNAWRPARQNDIPRKLEQARYHDERRVKEHRRHEAVREERHERRQEVRKEFRDERHAERPQEARREFREERHEHRRDERHAPRQGERRRYQGTELSYDSRIGAYAIINRPGLYFYNERFIRRHRGGWESANKLNGVWHPAKRDDIPEKLMTEERPKKGRPKYKDVIKSITR